MADATTWEQMQRTTGPGLRRPASGEAGWTYDRAFQDTFIPVFEEVELVEDDRVLSFRADWGPTWGILAGQSFRQDTRGLLPAFVRLADADPEQFLAFARKWGPLQLCKHEVPVAGCHCRRLGCVESNEVSREPIEAWRRLASAARGLMAVSIKLHRGERWRDTDWEAAHKLHGEQVDLDRRHGTDPWWMWLYVGRLLENWFDMAGTSLGMCPRGREEGGGISVNLVANGLFAAIARELTFSVAKVSGLATCSGCGQIYAPTRKPRSDRLNFCTECGTRAAWRMSKQRARKRSKAG